MCGLVGFFGAGGRADLARMMDSLQHRGPDGQGAYCDEDERIYLGHKRLSIVDIEGGRQPMGNRDGSIQVVFNGEIYNHYELRSQLIALGHEFVTDHSDTEVLVHGYKEWGHLLPAKLNGMFSFAIYDMQQGRLFLARDRFGEKPLYFSVQPWGIAFASELKSVLFHPQVSRTISKRGMKKFFAYGFIPAPETIIDSVSKLKPGHHLSYDIRTGRHVIEDYWRFRLDPQEASEAQLTKELTFLVDQAVERRLMSDVPLGVFLSGGVDSSIVLSSVVQCRSAHDVDTFSIGFQEKTFDESKYAREVAVHFGTRHHEKIIDSQGARGVLERILHQMDEPLGDPSLLPTFFLAEFARQDVKVALGGDGADELFAGYDPFKALRAASLYGRLIPDKIHELMLTMAERVRPADRNMSLEFRIKRTLRGLTYPDKLWNPVWLGPVDPVSLGELFNEPAEVDETYSEALADWNEFPDYSITEHTLSFYTNLYLPNNILTKVDRATMMASLESRAPFLDNDLVSFVEKIPTNLKLNGSRTKYLLKQAFSHRLPQSVMTRPKKGFGIPLSAWLRDWDDSDFINNLPYINKAWLSTKWMQHKTRHSDNRQLLWCAITLSRFIDSLKCVQ